MFMSYDWPGNVRELENMIKRFVILQDEALVMRELDKPRLMPSAYATATQEYAPAYHAPPPDVPPADEEEDEDEAVEVAAPAPEGRRLSEVAREASLAAERTIIADTLRQVHWNRRKAGVLLGVSYKTLLNKIKETGIERP